MFTAAKETAALSPACDRHSAHSDTASSSVANAAAQEIGGSDQRTKSGQVGDDRPVLARRGSRSDVPQVNSRDATQASARCARVVTPRSVEARATRWHVAGERAIDVEPVLAVARGVDLPGALGEADHDP
jgi:hypothetical protein